MPRVHFANNVMTRTSDATVEYKELQTPLEHMLRIEPEDTIYFTHGDSNESGFKITSISKIPITFKIQTTSPEKFRVRPRCGVLAPNESMNIGILLKAEHKLSDGAKDKFLVMCMSAATTDCNASEIAELWKNKPTNSYDVEQHRLVCKYKDGGKDVTCGGGSRAVDGKGAGVKSAPGLADSTLSDLQKQLKFTQTLQYVTLGLLALVALGFIYLMSQQIPSPDSCAYKGKVHACGRK